MKRRSYTEIVGQVVRSQRVLLGVDLAPMAKSLGLSTSGWSRVETGDTTMTIVQLRKAARLLRTTPAAFLQAADALVKQLEASGVTVTDDHTRAR